MNTAAISMQRDGGRGANTNFKMNSSIIFSCVRASANAGPTCIRATIDSSTMLSCMYWFWAGGYVPFSFLK